MADEQKAGIGESRTNGEGPEKPEAGDEGSEPTAEERRQRQLEELTLAYNRAREDLNQAIRNVRAEMAAVDFDQARTRAKSWVDENPTLAVFLGVGAGILTGKLLSGAFRSEPPPLSVRARRRAEALAGDAGDYAGELGTLLAHQFARAMHEAGSVGSTAAKRGGEVAEDLGRRARSLGDEVSHQAERTGRDLSKRAERAGRDFSKRAERTSRDLSKRAERAGRDVSKHTRELSDVVSRKADDVAEALAESSARSFHELEDAAYDLSKTVKKRSKRAKKSAGKNLESGLDYSGAVLNAARTAVAAVVIKKVNDWMKQLR